MKKLAICIIIAWAVIITFITIQNEIIINTGREILLKTVPVDPRDFLRGDYVILNYDISRINLKELEANRDYSDNYRLKRGKTVYVVLESSQNKAFIVKVTDKMPSTDKLFIKGKVKRRYKDVLYVNYGIESYFVPEGKGKEIERARGKNLYVKVTVNKLGNAKIKDFIFEE